MKFGKPPAAPFRRGFWRSPIRGPRLIAVWPPIKSPAQVLERVVQPLQNGGFGTVSLRENQIMDDDSLLAFTVNGVDLSMGHGCPARAIAPNNPGVNNTNGSPR